MDYWHKLKLTMHDDSDAFFQAIANERFWLFSTKAATLMWEANFTPTDFLIFGSETAGISETILGKYSDRVLRIPQVPEERCLNLSTAAGIALYEALRQMRQM
jgi:tRNA (cytidine/uridine-2'-O-)-methyltransferase